MAVGLSCVFTLSPATPGLPTYTECKREDLLHLPTLPQGLPANTPVYTEALKIFITNFWEIIAIFLYLQLKIQIFQN